MAYAVDISRQEAEMIAGFGGLLAHWGNMAQNGTLRPCHLCGVSDLKTGTKTGYSLDDIKDYVGMSSPQIQMMFKYPDEMSFGLKLRQTAEILNVIQRRVDLCREGINQDGRSFAVYFRLVNGDPDAVEGSVLADPLDVAVHNHGGPAAFTTSEHELRSFKKAVQEHVCNLPRVSAKEIARAIRVRMAEQGSLRQEVHERHAVDISGGKFEN